MIAGENDTYVMPCIRYRVWGIRFLMRGKCLGDGWSDPTEPEYSKKWIQRIEQERGKK